MSWDDLTDDVLTATTRELGSAVRYYPQSAPPFDLLAVWLAPEQIAQGGGETRIQTNAVRLGVRLADFPVPPAAGDVVERVLKDATVQRWRVQSGIARDREGGAELPVLRE